MARDTEEKKDVAEEKPSTEQRYHELLDAMGKVQGYLMDCQGDIMLLAGYFNGDEDPRLSEREVHSLFCTASRMLDGIEENVSQALRRVDEVV